MSDQLDATPVPEIEAPEDKHFTQEEVNRFIAADRRKDREAIADLQAKVESLTPKAARADELEAAQMTELEKLAKERDDLAARITASEAREQAARIEALRVKVGTAAGLPADFIDVLKGDDEDSIKAHAEKLAAAIPKAPAMPPAVTQDVMQPGKEDDPLRKAFLGVK